MGKPMDRSTRFLVAPPMRFEEALPTLHDALIEYYEVGKGTEYSIGAPWPEKIPYGARRSLRECGGLLACSNPFCNRGGFEIDQDVFQMVRSKLTQGEFKRTCPGDEGSPKGRRMGRRCLNRLYYRITLKYKSEQGPIPAK